MIQPESQPGCDRSPTYFDAESLDLSEEQFSASLENTVQNPVFEVDGSEAGPLDERLGRHEIENPGIGPAENAAFDLASAASGDAESAQSLSSDRDTPSNSSTSQWREQVSAKVNSYKSRSRHKPRYPSLQLQFDESSYGSRPPAESPRARPEAVPTFSQSVAAEIVAMQPAPRTEPEPQRVTLEATARVLEFPRPAAPAYNPDQLAEPVFDRPRIVEAPELLPPPPAMGGILIEPSPEPEPERMPGLDVPLQSATLSRRLWAGAVDLLLLAIATATFTYVFIRTANTVPAWRTVAELCGMLMAVLWPAYQYAFNVFCEATPGLRLAGLQVQRFDGRPAARSLRRWRVLASFLSAAALFLGYAWCFMDEDQLNWHDRATRTHLAPVRRV